MLKNFNPSFVFDLTATPKKKSNIIAFVDADHADEFITHAAAHLEEKGITGWQTEILRADSNGARIVIE